MTAAGTPPSQQRFAFIHALRGIAALLVVWSHLSAFWLLENGKTSALQDLWYQAFVKPFHIYQNGGHLGVVLFFLISGFIITHASLRESRRAFAIRRVLRIFPPLIVATAVAWVLFQVSISTDTRLLGVEGGSVWHWLSGTVLIDGFLPGGRVLDVTWTLVIELMFYAMTFAFLGLTRSRPVTATWIMVAVWVAVCVFAMVVGSSFLASNAALAPYVGFLLAGRVIYLWQRGDLAGFDALLLGALTVGCYLLFVEAAEPGFLIAPGGWVGIEPIVTYGIALLTFLLLLRWAPARTIQPFAFLGDISYSLYLLHLPVGITVLNLLDRVGIPESVNTVIAILAAIGVSYLGYILVEKPAQRLARRFTKPSAPTPIAETAA